MIEARQSPPADGRERFAALRRAIRPGTRGIEIGPWRDPVAPKAAGYDTLAARPTLGRLRKARLAARALCAIAWNGLTGG